MLKYGLNVDMPPSFERSPPNVLDVVVSINISAYRDAGSTVRSLDRPQGICHIRIAACDVFWLSYFGICRILL